MQANKLIVESQELRESIIKFTKGGVRQGLPVVAAYGLFNSGKSFLLNMLINHTQDEYFKTNDIRETAELKDYVSDSLIFLDTPGLDANCNDNVIAFKGQQIADTVLFVHQLQGELDSLELSTLSALKESFGAYAKTNIIIVLTKIDKASEQSVSAIESRIREQCIQLLGLELKVISVSNTRYQKGIIESKDGLIKNSQIQDLRTHIERIALNTGSVRLERFATEKLALASQLSKIEHEVKAELAQRLEATIGKTEPFESAFVDFKKSIKSLSKRYLKV